MTVEIVLLLGLIGLLALAIGLDLLRADVAALLALMTLAGLQTLPFIDRYVEPSRLFIGFSSEAVVALIGIMILSEGFVRSGLIFALADRLADLGKGNVRRTIFLLFSGVSTMSLIVQNAGATSLSLPVASRLADRLNIENRQLLMPLGVFVLLGGTATMIGNSALLILNDLLPESLTPLAFFEAFPIAGAMFVVALVYYCFLPGNRYKIAHKKKDSRGAYLERVYRLHDDTRVYQWTGKIPLKPCTVKVLEEKYQLRIVALYNEDLILSPTRNYQVPNNSFIAVLSTTRSLDEFEKETGMSPRTDCKVLNRALSSDYTGIVELIVTPGSEFVGQSIRDIRMRHRFGFAPLAIFRGETILDGDIRQQELCAGDILLGHISWPDLNGLEAMDDFVMVAIDKPSTTVTMETQNKVIGILLFLLAYGLFVQPRLSILLMTGAVLMLGLRVITPEQAYRAISWRTIFMLSGLIPFSEAMMNSGTSTWLAHSFTNLLGEAPSGIVLLIFFSVLAALFSMLVSNVAAVIILVPVAIEVSQLLSLDPSGLILLIGISVSNVFLMPTNQVTSLIASAGNFHSRDFFRAGTPAAIGYLLITVAGIAVLYPYYL